MGKTFNRLMSGMNTRVSDGANLVALRGYAGRMDNALGRMGVPRHTRPQQPCEWASPGILMHLHNAAVQAARVALDPRRQGNGRWHLMDQQRFTAEAANCLAAGTGWDARAVAELIRRSTVAKHHRNYGDPAEASRMEQALRRLDDRFGADPAGLERQLIAAFDAAPAGAIVG